MTDDDDDDDFNLLLETNILVGKNTKTYIIIRVTVSHGVLR